jgi:deoxyribose-phosphate aldolase
MTPAPTPPTATAAPAADVHALDGAARAALARRLLGLLDLTLLDEAAGSAEIDALCRLAANRFHAPAALCVAVQHVAQARGLLDRLRLPRVAVATVVNFPDGSTDLVRIEHEARQALAAGADELDAVLPWAALRAGDVDSCRSMLAICRDACGGQALLKVIIESGQLGSAELIEQASLLAIDGGADFIKTSTGLAAVNATLPAAETMLRTIAARGGRCGFKAAGDITTLDQALPYLQLAEALLGRDWIGPGRFRIGASTLLHDLLAVLEVAEPAGAAV